MSSAPRNPTIDMCRGIGIALVVFSHAWALPDPVYRAIYSMAFPAFLLRAGLVFQPSRAVAAPASHLWGKFMRLVVPAWGMGLVLAVPYIVAWALGRFPDDEFAMRFVGTMTGSAINEWNFLSTPLWSLFCLFWLDVAATALARLGPSVAGALMTSVGLVWIVFTQGGGTWSDVNPVEWPFSLRNVGCAMVFYGAGLWLGGGKGPRAAAVGPMQFTPASLTMRRALLLVVTLAVWVLAVRHAPDVLNVSRNRIGTTPMAMAMTLLAAFAGTALLWQVVVLLPTSRAVVWLGTHTLPVFGFNYLVNKIVFETATRAGVEVARLGNWWWVLALIELGLLCAIAWVLDRMGPIGDLFNGRPLKRVGREKARMA